MSLRETYNSIAESWHQAHQDDDWWVKGTNTFISYLSPGDLVLDAGCGGGTKSRYLIRNGLRVIGVDISEAMIDIATREVPQGNFRVLALEDLNQLKEEFEGVFMQASLLHVPKSDALNVVKEAASKLKNGGYFYIAVKEKRLGGIDEEIKVENDYGYDYERFFSYFTLDELKSYLEEAGCEVIFTDAPSSPHTSWLQVIGKKNGNGTY